MFHYSGVHPHDAKSWDDNSEAVIKELLENQECVAVGECGLDFNRNFSPPQTQLEVFEKQVRISFRDFLTDFRGIKMLLSFARFKSLAIRRSLCSSTNETLTTKW